MSIFEFLTVAVSIVLALGLSKLISSTPHVFDERKRDWLHASYFVFLVAAHIIVWWRIWLLNDVSSWNILQFVILMGSPLSLYLGATALVSVSPEQVDDWKAYFQNHSRWILAALAAVIFFGLARSYFIQEILPPWWGFFWFALYAGAAYSEKRAVHIFLIVFSLFYVAYLLSRNFTAA
jgi:hypothetical protein